MFMLDTDICSYIIKKNPPAVAEKLEKKSSEGLCISVITQAELLYGLERYPERKKFNRLVHGFIETLVVMEWDSPAAEEYASLRAHQEIKGKPVANMDMLIAAHALSLGATLVTNNTRHFAHIPKLKTENWV